MRQMFCSLTNNVLLSIYDHGTPLPYIRFSVHEHQSDYGTQNFTNLGLRCVATYFNRVAIL